MCSLHFKFQSFGRLVFALHSIQDDLSQISIVSFIGVVEFLSFFVGQRWPKKSWIDFENITVQRIGQRAEYPGFRAGCVIGSNYWNENFYIPALLEQCSGAERGLGESTFAVAAVAAVANAIQRKQRGRGRQMEHASEKWVSGGREIQTRTHFGLLLLQEQSRAQTGRIRRPKLLGTIFSSFFCPFTLSPENSLKLTHFSSIPERTPGRLSEGESTGGRKYFSSRYFHPHQSTSHSSPTLPFLSKFMKIYFVRLAARFCVWGFR